MQNFDHGLHNHCRRSEASLHLPELHLNNLNNLAHDYVMASAVGVIVVFITMMTRAHIMFSLFREGLWRLDTCRIVLDGGDEEEVLRVLLSGVM